MTTPPPWSAVRALFDEALPLNAAARETLFARSTLAGDLVAEVRSLLEHHEASTGGALSQPAAAAAAAAAGTAAMPARARSEENLSSPDDAHELRAGQRVGPWRITSLLGRGGMGEVWLAARDDGAFEGQAAIKVLKRGMDSAAVLARFASEQQTLARLTHPHIARLLDAGRTPAGQPFFVMEHVKGRAIDQACAGRPLAERLRLFLQLADAVAYAHRNLLVHRDLKPSNVMVDEEGRVKLLDFGIAKALDPLAGAVGDAAELTAAGERPFTPHYASPEQVRGEPVSTSTDIYSLGVLLYVLLTGQRPYGRHATTPAEAARCVLEETPSRPSSLALPAPEWVRTRRQLQGDLDNVLLKALEKDVAARYSSVEALAADVRAYLDGFPVSARTAGTLYRLRKLVARHRLATAALSAALLAVLASAGVALWQAHEADGQRAMAQKRFDEVRQLAGQLVFKYHDQLEYVQGATKVRESLLVDAAAFLDRLRSAAIDDPALAQELAATYYRVALLQGASNMVNTGQHAQAEANIDKAIALHALYVRYPSTPTDQVADAVDMLVSKAEMRQRLGRMNEALAIILPAEPLVEGLVARNATDWAARTSAIGLHGVLARMLGTSVSYANLGRFDEARRHIDAALGHAQAMLAPSPNNVESLNTYGFVLGERGNWQAQTGDAAGAAATFSEQMALRDRNAASKPDDAQFRNQRVVVRSNLAGALAMAGQHADARRMMAEAQALALAAAAADPGNRAAQQRLETLQLLDARLHLLAGDAAGARHILTTALPAVPVPAGREFVDVRWRAEALLWAARAWRVSDAKRALGHAEEAAGLMAGSDENASRAWMLALARGERALALAALGQAAQAEAAAREALATWPAQVPGSYGRFVEPVRALVP